MQLHPTCGRAIEIERCDSCIFLTHSPQVRAPAGAAAPSTQFHKRTKFDVAWSETESHRALLAHKIYRARAPKIGSRAQPTHVRRAIPASTATIGAKCMTLAYTPRISRGRIFHLWSSASEEVTASAARLVFMLSTPRNARLMLTPRKELIRRIVLAVLGHRHLASRDGLLCEWNLLRDMWGTNGGPARYRWFVIYFI